MLTDVLQSREQVQVAASSGTSCNTRAGDGRDRVFSRQGSPLATSMKLLFLAPAGCEILDIKSTLF